MVAVLRRSRPATRTRGCRGADARRRSRRRSSQPLGLAPYTKLLTANIEVDQASALILCSAAAAEAAGVPRDRWVFPWAGAHATDEWFVSHRDVAHRIAGDPGRGAASSTTPASPDRRLTHVDLYSCFPAAVQIAAHELGLSLDRHASPSPAG